MDFDPDGVAILFTYKHGSVSLAHEGMSLVTPNIRTIGLTRAQVVEMEDTHQQQGLILMTTRDRKKASKMLDHELLAEGGKEGAWRLELQVMLVISYKAELQILDSCQGTMSRVLEDQLFRTADGQSLQLVNEA
jgi:meiotic recombination protein SPO11